MVRTNQWLSRMCENGIPSLGVLSAELRKNRKFRHMVIIQKEISGLEPCVQRPSTWSKLRLW